MLKFVASSRSVLSRTISNTLNLPTRSISSCFAASKSATLLQSHPASPLTRTSLAHPHTHTPHTTQLTHSFSTKAQSDLFQTVSREIVEETRDKQLSRVPRGFTVKSYSESRIELHRADSDGVQIELEMDLAGSIDFAEHDEEGEVDENVEKQHRSAARAGQNDATQQHGEEEDGGEGGEALSATPEFTIRLVQPKGATLTYLCSFPPGSVEAAVNAPDDDKSPTFSVDKVSVSSVPGYFVYSDLFDDNVYNDLMSLLLERGLDVDFQCDLVEFCTAEEHRLYVKFLEGVKDFCKSGGSQRN